MTSERIQDRVDPIFASIMNLMLPGLGQMLQGQVMRGIIFSILVALGYYSYMYPGIIIQSICIADTAIPSWSDFKNNKSKLKQIFTFLFISGPMIFYLFYRNI